VFASSDAEANVSAFRMKATMRNNCTSAFIEHRYSSVIPAGQEHIDQLWQVVAVAAFKDHRDRNIDAA
jgi:hypothetical protein